jgi:hypothetical protein
LVKFCCWLCPLYLQIYNFLYFLFSILIIKHKNQNPFRMLYPCNCFSRIAKSDTCIYIGSLGSLVYDFLPGYLSPAGRESWFGFCVFGLCCCGNCDWIQHVFCRIVPWQLRENRRQEFSAWLGVLSGNRTSGGR